MEKEFIDVDGKEIIHNDEYILLCDINRRMTKGTLVEVVELCQSDYPFTYCYGKCGGSAYVRQDQLKQKS